MDDLVCEEGGQSDWIPARRLLGAPLVQHVPSFENVEPDQFAAPETQSDINTCPSCGASVEPDQRLCVACGYWLKRKEDSDPEDLEYGELPTFTFASDRYIIKHLIGSKYKNFENSRRMGRLIGICSPLVLIIFFIWIFEPGSGMEHFESEVLGPILGLVIPLIGIGIIILSIHHMQFGLAMYWFLPKAFSKDHRRIAVKLIFMFFVHAVYPLVPLIVGATAGHLVRGHDLIDSGLVYAVVPLGIAYIFLLVAYPLSIFVYPYCILCGRPFHDGIYLEYWHGTDKLGWENYQKDLYTKRIRKDGKLVFWKKWRRSGKSYNLQKHGYNANGKSDSPLGVMPFLYRMALDSRQRWGFLRQFWLQGAEKLWGG